ncbi:ribosome small subunit-dependent GTPase A [Motilibacter deserti]|uniref:Small ribosomal subunit biogenesis GTPase RsgA n=1 Tax=Motilibacter deserti TaxID=2714956 RepID=A0ABX0GS71_9ACTN|nr:ribosome small subunit-dependent GTPase A [Motilibacter deserti]NHC13343.1 ribosome small subunit-dependent GTPase A [Motilibacter deserti]
MPGPRRRRDLDEDDIRVRPGRGKSRPRTKDRPEHAGATEGRVVAVDRGRYTCVVDEEAEPRELTAMKARELGRKGVVVGDRVALVGDLAGGTDALARVVRVEPRANTLRRTADDTDPVERVLVANADQLVIVTATVNPEPRPRLLDRCLVAAYDAGLDPLLCITKTDLKPPDELIEAYAALDVPWIASRPGDGLAELRSRLRGRTSVLVGHSGVGKSTLVNALVPGARRAVGHVNAVTGRGRHTSSSAIMFRLVDGSGWVIDTPGVRSFGLAHVDPSRVVGAFPDLAAGMEECPRGCTHDEPECALDEWVASGSAGSAGPARLESLRRLLRARGGAGEDVPDEEPEG